ncbi:hypothetical protein DPMN_048632 [Dreissena polymorpha]|uniref:Uncharacterized protein n=1 Tax=Dreissena polymorpha TaxID=45954 RepID=A0A9D4DB18_DREPO|nr:hypothetical protein DPMN_048632 [Dreissena polymorpha]
MLAACSSLHRRMSGSTRRSRSMRSSRHQPLPVGSRFSRSSRDNTPADRKWTSDIVQMINRQVWRASTRRPRKHA